jgi:hypothetical protein
MTEISDKSVSDVHGIIQNYEIENNSKFRVVKKDVNFGNDGKGISSSRSCIVKSRVGYFAYSLDDVVASTGPV